MICKSCGANIADDATFCTSCGTPVEAEETAAVEEPVVTPEAEVEAKDPGKVFGLISMICGIVGVALGALGTCCCGCLGGGAPFIASIAGIVLGVLGMNKSKAADFDNKQAKLGMILSIVGVAVVIIITIVNAVAGGISGYMQSMY